MLVLMVALLVAPRARAADPLDPRAVPEPLKPWTAWALDGKDDASCPLLGGHGDATRCAWPSRVELSLDERGGKFSQAWHVDANRWVPLPGDGKRWPADVKVDGASAVVLARGGAPSVALHRGDHVVTGSFAWDSLPSPCGYRPRAGFSP